MVPSLEMTYIPSNLFLQMFLYLTYMIDKPVTTERNPPVLANMEGKVFDTLVEVTEDEESEDDVVEDKTKSETLCGEEFAQQEVSISDEEVVIIEMN